MRVNSSHLPIISTSHLSIPRQFSTSQSPTPGTPLLPRNPSRFTSSLVKSGSRSSYEIRLKSGTRAFPFSDTFALAHGPPRHAPYILSVTYHSPAPSFPSRPSSSLLRTYTFLVSNPCFLVKRPMYAERSVARLLTSLFYCRFFDLSSPSLLSCNCLLSPCHINPRAGLLVGRATAPSSLLFSLCAL
jgi:hypothetical protein